MAADHQLDLLLTYQYPASPGFKKRATSKAAADSMASRAGTLRAEVLRVILRRLRHRPPTRSGLLSFLKRVLAIRPRDDRARPPRRYSAMGIDKRHQSARTSAAATQSYGRPRIDRHHQCKRRCAVSC